MEQKRSIKRPEVIKVGLSFWLLPVVFLFGLVSGWLIWGRDVTPVQEITDTAPTDGQIVRRDVSLDDDPAIGTENAPITIVEFSDYQCPFCARWHQQVYPDLMKAYEGKIKFVYRDFPLYSIHPQAEAAAIAANCAGDQNSYWLYHELLFNGGKDLGRETFIDYAGQIGIDSDAFTKCIDEERSKDEISKDYSYASSLGVSSTPTFFVNGIAVVGAQPIEVFKQVIDAELAGKNQ